MYIFDKVEKDKEYGARPIMRVIQDDIENKITGSIKKDIEVSIEEVQKAGLDKVIYYDLTREEIGVNVARVIIPKAELYCLDEERLGNRALEYDRKVRLGKI